MNLYFTNTDNVKRQHLVSGRQKPSGLTFLHAPRVEEQLFISLRVAVCSYIFQELQAVAVCLGNQHEYLGSG